MARVSHNYDVGLKPVKLKTTTKELAEKELARHILRKPPIHDIQARTTWAQMKDVLELQVKTSKG